MPTIEPAAIGAKAQVAAETYGVGAVEAALGLVPLLALWTQKCSRVSAAPAPMIATTTPTSATSLAALLTVADVAALLGVRTQWVYAETAKGALPAIKLGRKLRFRAADLDSYLGSLMQQQ